MLACADFKALYGSKLPLALSVGVALSALPG